MQIPQTDRTAALLDVVSGALFASTLFQVAPMRAAVRLAVGIAPLGAAFMLYHAGLPGLLALFHRFAARVRLYPVFFATMAIGKLIGVAFLGGRR